MNSTSPVPFEQMTPLFALTVQSGDNAVRELSQKIVAGIAPLKLGGEEIGTVELVLAEALNNVVEHAYAPTKISAGPIMVMGAFRSDGLHIQIEDEGITMPDDKPLIGGAQNLDVELQDLPEGGFGWFMIQQLAKDVHYSCVNNRNRLRLRLAVGL